MADLRYEPSGNNARGMLKRLGGSNPILRMQNQAKDGTGSFRASQPLPPEAGEEMDNVITEVGIQRLSVAASLMEFVSRPLPNWFSVMTKQHEKISRQGRASLTMKPGGRSPLSLVDRTPVSTPIYAAEQRFSFHERFMAVADAAGVGLEDDSLKNAAININEITENAAIFAPATKFNNIESFGLETAPSANSLAFSGSNPAWDNALKTGEEILDDYLAMRTLAFDDFHFGPFVLWHEKNYQSPLSKLYSDGTTTQSLTVREMLLKNEELLDIRVADQLADDVVFLAEMVTSTCGIYIGQPTTWLPMPVTNFEHEFLALASMVPYFRDDFDGGSGIVKGTV